MARHVVLGIGGTVDLWLAVSSLDELVDSVRLARQHGCPVLILGSGANLLVSDKGIRGMVVHNRCQGVTFDVQDPPRVLAHSGTKLASLARQAASQGLGGLEWAVGVPGTLGGAVVNNAGAHGASMADSLVQAELLTPAGVREWQPAKWFEYVYRSSRLKAQPATAGGGHVVLQAELRLSRRSPAETKAQMAHNAAQRRSSQPSGLSIGSMFKNPPGDYAGRLIEAAGLKGRQIGGARVSEVHANFFLNTGGARAADFIALIELARDAVKTKFDVDLELEIQPAGDWSE